MASACVNNIGMSPESFIDLAPATYGWLSPRISFSRDDESSKLAAPKQPPQPAAKSPPPSELPDLEAQAGDFEFRLEDPVGMLPADELFSDGKLVPLQLSSVKPQVNDATIGEPIGKGVLTGSNHPDLFLFCNMDTASVPPTDLLLFFCNTNQKNGLCSPTKNVREHIHLKIVEPIHLKTIGPS